MEIFEADEKYKTQINTFYKAQGYHSDWSDTERAFICLTQGQVIGSVKVECINNVTILRGMYVSSQYQRQGIGKRLLKFIEPVLNEKIGYCMPLSHVAEYYKQIGFAEVELDSYPEFLKDRCKSYIKSGYKIKTMKREIAV